MARADAVRGGISSAGLFRAAVGVFATLLVLIALVLATEWLSRPDLFPVRAVQFEGEFRHVAQAELAAAVEGAAQGNFLLLDLDTVKARAESLAWVYQAEVRRRWPRDLLIRFTEQRLLARWNDPRDAGNRTTPGDSRDGGGRAASGTAAGAVADESDWVNQGMQAVRVGGNDLPSNVPLLEGPAGTQAIVYERFRDFNRLLADAGLQVRKLTLTPRRTWELELTDGFMLVLDRAQPDKKLERFARAYPRTLARAGTPIRHVDLRYTNGFSVTWHPPRAAARNGMKTAAPVGAANEEG
ncbi:MAG: FtsQ-type POTRA domain-containing protein [Gammaproteobacteria bacterium]|nr:FtsQ-type POTRA domain-containing protein [Gammaproteobacteria bacterium]